MLICVSNGFAVVRTPFDEKYDLIQKFRGLEQNASVRYNQPVDFMESGLMQRDKWDYWHIDVPFALNTDEAVPAFVNGYFIGANHGHHGAVSVYAPAHGKTVADVGSLWRDESGMKFTLMRVENADYLLFLSENTGDSVENYAFATKLEGMLTYLENGENTGDIRPIGQGASDLRRAIRHKEKKVVGFVNGEERTAFGELVCDRAEIREEYEIVNPATVAEALRAARPKGGYASQPDLAEYGRAMLRCRLTYRLENDGTVLTVFDYEKLMNVRFQRFMGVMYQEKLDVYGGGIFRYLPKTKPIATREGTFDFSKRVAIVGAPFPRSDRITREYWTDEKSPCERAVDYFRNKDGADKLAFASGFLPVYDGVPSVREKQLSSVATLKFTRKHYPTFADGDLTRVRGVGYKKYFLPKANGASIYSVPFGGKTYLYADIFEENELRVRVDGKTTLLEKREGIAYEIQDGVLKIRGSNGFAVFSVE